MTVPGFEQSHRITADIVVPENGAEGVIISNGGRGRMGGFVLYVKDDRLVYETNSIVLTSSMALPRGKVELAYEFLAESPKDISRYGASRGVGRLYINEQLGGEVKLTNFTPGQRGILDIGQNRVSPVSTAYKMPFKFTGRLDNVRVDLK